MLSRALLALMLFASAAQAQVTPVIFERENIRIESPLQKMVMKDPKEAEAPAPTAHAPLVFDVEIRPEDALRLEYIHTLNSLTDTSGVMIAFSAPSVVALPPLQVPTAVDALFVMNDGTVAQIMPNVVLADITQEIVAQKPIKAFLFLKAGAVAAKAIQPGDVIYGKRFASKPQLMK